MLHMPGERCLLINADDFGLTAGVNRAVGELHAAGALTSATLMAGGAAFEDAVRVAREHPGLDVGCHAVLVDGTPVAVPESVPTLVDGAGRFRDSLGKFVVALQRGRIAEAEIEAEATAQIRALQRAGVRVTHVDTHKHMHVFPRVARPLLRAAAACGVGAIRNPFEPAWSVRRTRGALVRRLEVTALRGFERAFLRLVREFGMATTDGCVGVSATGRLDAGSLAEMLREMPAGTWELVCHPGYSDAALDAVKTRLRGTREVELAALLEVVPGAGVRLGTFAGLQG